MSKVLVTDTYLTNIADSIRAKNGSSDTYLPSEMSGAIDDMTVITDEQMADLNEAVNYRSGRFDTNTIPQMIDELKSQYFVNFTANMEVMEVDTTPWVRPQDWPDLDSLNLSMSGNTDFIYMTFATKPYTGFAINVVGSNVEVTTGHITNGEYIVDSTLTAQYNTNYGQAFTSTGYQVVRVTGTLTTCTFMDISMHNSNNEVFVKNFKQAPLLERIAYVPNLTKLSTDANRGNWSTYSLQREKIANGTGTNLQHLNFAYMLSLNLRSLDLSGLHTPNITSMQNTFFRCHKLYDPLDLRHFNVSKVTSFYCAFSYCWTSEINVTGWITSAVTSFSGTFSYCYRLKYIKGIEGFYTNNVTNLYTTFYWCINLRELNLSNWNVDKVSNIGYLFAYCCSLKNLEWLSNWNLSKITNLTYTFAHCHNIEKLDLHNWDTSLVTNVSYAFQYCVNLRQLNITGWSITNITTAGYCFQYCMSLQYLDLSNWIITSACTSIYYMFSGCYSLRYLDLPAWDLSGLTASNYTISYVFNLCYSLKRITGISNWVLPSGNTPSIFASCYSLEEVDVSNWNTSQSKSMANMFQNCYSLKNLDVSNWTTTNVTTFASMFANCYNLSSLDVSGFNTSNATSMATMFSTCYSLTTVGDISGWNTGKVTTFSEMFRYCYSLKSLNLDNWDVRKATAISYMFGYCYNMKTLSAKNWNLAVCTTMTETFYSCFSLESLDLSGWTCSALTTVPSNLFRYCYALKNFTGVPVALNHSYAQCVSLSYDSILAIYTVLPTVSSTKTITVDQYVNDQLSSTEKAIATNKGWTISTTTSI